jgi:hypothetical protein
MQHHQLDMSCKHSFALPSLHSMLGSGAAASKLPSGSAAEATAATAAAGGRVSTAGMMPQDQDINMQDCPAGACSSEQQAAGRQGSLWSSSWSPAAGTAHARLAAPVADAGCGAAGAESAQSVSQLAHAFMQACASPGAVAALAVLDHNNLLPVLPVESPSDESASEDDDDDCAPGKQQLHATAGCRHMLAGGQHGCHVLHGMHMSACGTHVPATTSSTASFLHHDHTQVVFAQNQSTSRVHDICASQTDLRHDCAAVICCFPSCPAELCGCLCATLGYMFVLARRCGVMGMLTDGSADPDTIIRTLVSQGHTTWDTL